METKVEMDINRSKFDILDALDAMEAGVSVDPAHLNDLKKDLQGDHECHVSFGPENGFGDEPCDKNPGHENFIHAEDFKLEHLPPEFRTHENLESIQQWSVLTVKINGKYVSVNRLDTFPDGETPYPFHKIRGSRRLKRFGSGYVLNVIPMNADDEGKICPCPLCRKSDNPERRFWFTQVFTANHVIYDDSEAIDIEVECFYDSDLDKSGLKIMYGMRLEDGEG